MWGRKGGLQTESFTAYALQKGQLVDFVISNVAVPLGITMLPCVFSISYLLPETVLELGVDRE